MASHFISEILVLFLLLLSSARFIFITRVHSDSLSIVPFVAFIISLLNILAWGLYALDILICLVSFFVAIWNLRALLRFLSHLVIDHYGPWFILISIINLLLIIAMTFLVIYFRPGMVNFKKYGVTYESKTYHGSFAEGFDLVENPFDLSSAQVWNYEKIMEPQKEEVQSEEEAQSQEETVSEEKPQSEEVALKEEITPEEKTEARKIILFIPSKLASPEIYEGFYAKLAKDGYSVYTAEFNTKEQTYFKGIKNFRMFRRFFFINYYYKEGAASYTELLKQNREKLKAEFNSLIKIVSPSKEDFVFIVTEEDPAEILDEVQSENAELIDGCYALSETSGYMTSGWGPVENTEPFSARILGVERDGSMYMSSHLASELEKTVVMCQKVTVD